MSELAKILIATIYTVIIHLIAVILSPKVAAMSQVLSSLLVYAILAFLVIALAVCQVFMKH